MEYRIKVIGTQGESAKLFYISKSPNSLQDWLTTLRADAAVYYNLESARRVINQGINSIKQDLDLFYHCDLEEIQIAEEKRIESIVQTFKPSDI
jgi:hypothetical protein